MAVLSFSFVEYFYLKNQTNDELRTNHSIFLGRTKYLIVRQQVAHGILEEEQDSLPIQVNTILCEIHTRVEHNQGFHS